MDNSQPFKESVSFDMKIGSRYATWYDYGKHLLRMLKSAKDYRTFVTENAVWGKYVVSIDMIKPIEKTILPEEFGRSFYDFLNSDGGFSYRRNLNFVYAHPDNEKEVIDVIAEHKGIEFYVGK